MVFSPMATRSPVALSVLVILCLAQPVWSDIIAEYDIRNNSSSSIPASNLAEHISASSLTVSGVDVLTGYGKGIFVANAWSESSAPDMSRYYQWSVTADAGQAIDYGSIDLSLTRGRFQSNHGAESWQLFASTDDFTSSGLLLQNWDISATGFDFVTPFVDQDISLLGVQSGTVTFRLYGFNADHAGRSGDYSGLAYGHNDLTGVGTNLVIHGQSVPEPTTLGLLALGGLAILGRKKAAQPATCG